MLDTDKYEGHTPAPWDYEYGPTVSEHIDDADILTIKTEATFDEDKAWVNQRLAADAPLLLEAYKEKRDALHATHTWVEYNLLRLKNGAITKDELIKLLSDMCNDPAHKAIVGVTE